MVKNWFALEATAVGCISLAAVVIVAMLQDIDGALYFWVVAGIVFLIRGSLPDIWRGSSPPEPGQKDKKE